MPSSDKESRIQAPTTGHSPSVNVAIREYREPLPSFRLSSSESCPPIVEEPDAVRIILRIFATGTVVALPMVWSILPVLLLVVVVGMLLGSLSYLLLATALRGMGLAWDIARKLFG